MPRVISAIISAVVAAVGVALVSVPAGVITAGVLGLCGTYIWAYLGAAPGGD